VLSLSRLSKRLLETHFTATDLGRMGLASGVDLSAEVGSGGAGLGEVAGEDGLDERSEDNLGTTTGISAKVKSSKGGWLTQSGEEPST
jgi:hypothetical protein